MLVSVEQMTKMYNARTVLSDINLKIEDHDRIGLIGVNGCGKSTLLRLILGIEQPDEGIVSMRNDLTVGYLAQNSGLDRDRTIWEEMKSVFSDLLETEQQLREIERQMAQSPELHEKLSEEYSRKISFFESRDGYLIDVKIRTVLGGMGFADKPEDTVINTLSGGEKTRLAMAKLLLEEPQLLILDEPTNHLDFRTLAWLEEYLSQYKYAILVVSHDRTLLNLLPEICELEKHQISYYGGNYEFYKEQKTLMQEALQQRIEEKEKALRTARKVARETAERRDKQNVRGEKRNLKKGVPRIVLNGLQSKSEKSTAKLSGAHQEKTEKLTDERNQLRSSLSPTAALKTDFNSPGLHTGKILVTAKEINFGYHPDEPQLWRAPLSFQLKSGDRLRIEGGNGSGKTTLLKIITGQLQPLKGTLIQANFTYVYLNQEYSIINDRNSILEQAYAFNGRNLPEHEIKIILNRYLFPASEWDKSCRKLSGGEKMRLAFCCLMISNNMPDMFILDEPTNNLDIQSIEIITATIKNYAGTVIAISHDNYFIQEIGVEQSIFLS